ncbi:hypothetical protein E1B28_013890 [Marasmius oreades]|uniref:Uncharacterized protein n=1 Tax=Marasmius oreades TaxID=181124 RepID=A0A9P7RJJ2_9AGAR|nr:uncharacterized protein E1B28_013890 [Marasmius oreades]KAG7085269.1 hypothetical protein E1B28_013890 [Marasmius oreades]
MSSHPNRGIHTLSSHSNGRPPFLNERPLLAESSIDPIRGNAQTMRLPPLSSIYQPPAQILNACAGLPFDPNIRLMRLTNFSRLTNTSNLSRSIPTQSNQNIAGTNNPAFCPPTPFQLCSQNNSFPLRSAYPQQAVPSHPAHGLTPPKDLNPRMVLSDSTMHNAAALAPMNAHPSSFKRTLDNRDLRKPSLFRPSQPVKASSLHPLRSPSPSIVQAHSSTPSSWSIPPTALQWAPIQYVDSVDADAYECRELQKRIDAQVRTGAQSSNTSVDSAETSNLATPQSSIPASYRLFESLTVGFSGSKLTTEESTMPPASPIRKNLLC